MYYQCGIFATMEREKQSSNIFQSAADRIFFSPAQVVFVWLRHLFHGVREFSWLCSVLFLCFSHPSSPTSHHFTSPSLSSTSRPAVDLIVLDRANSKFTPHPPVGFTSVDTCVGSESYVSSISRVGVCVCRTQRMSERERLLICRDFQEQWHDVMMSSATCAPARHY